MNAPRSGCRTSPEGLRERTAAQVAVHGAAEPRVSRLLRNAPMAAPVSSGASETALRPARAVSRLRSCRASGDPVARASPPGIMNTPLRCAHAAT